MEQHIQDAEHYARVISGLENMDLAFAGVEALNDDGRYAQTTLRRLAHFDLGAHAGNEALSDKIKAGAAEAVKWIKQFIASIAAAVKSAGASLNKAKMEAAAAKLKEAKAKGLAEDVEKREAALYQSFIEPLNAAKRAVESVKEKPSEALGKLGDVDQLIAKIDKCIDSAKKQSVTFWADVIFAKEMLVINIPRANAALEKHAEEHGRDPQMTVGVANVKALSQAMSKLTVIGEKWVDGVGKLFDHSSSNADEMARDRRAGK